MKAVQYLAVVTIVSAATAAAADAPTVTFQSFGPARIGMGRQELESAIGTKLKGEPADDNSDCEYLAPTKGYDGVGFMFLKQRLARIDIWEPTVSTLSGARVGSSQDSVMALYRGRIKVSPHTYTDEGSYLTMHSADKRYGIRFETDRGKVTMFYAGTAEAIEYVEGCL